MDELRWFDVGDILSVTDGRLLSKRHMQGVYDILNYMTKDSLFTHQLPRASEVCRPYLREQHSDLVITDIPEFTGDEEEQLKILNEWLEQFGPPRLVQCLPAGVWNHINPIEELCDMVGPEKVFIIPLESE